MSYMEARWFALQVLPGKEKIIATILANKGYEQFLPLWTPPRQDSGHPGHALFPGYLFCRFDVNSRHGLIVTTPGILRIVGIGRVPYPLPDWEVENLRLVTSAGRVWRPEHRLQQGAKVRIWRGPFTGIEGILCKRNGKDRVVVQINLLGRGASLEVDGGAVAPLDQFVGDASAALAAGELFTFRLPAGPAPVRLV